jgi:polyhydroxyalkanoate synthesis regulator phasin
MGNAFNKTSSKPINNFHENSIVEKLNVMEENYRKSLDSLRSQIHDIEGKILEIYDMEEKLQDTIHETSSDHNSLRCPSSSNTHSNHEIHELKKENEFLKKRIRDFEKSYTKTYF